MTHTTHWEKDGIIRIFTGEINPEEILSSNFDIYNQPNFETIKYIINDFTDVTKLAINKDHTKIFATTDDIISDTKGNLKIAIVIKQNAHIALANNYREEMKNKFFKCEIFQTLKEAQIWVEL